MNLSTFSTKLSTNYKLIQIYKFAKDTGGFLLDVVFPETCEICGKEGNFLCEKCEKNLPTFNFPVCPNQACRKKLIAGRVCENCREITGLTRFFAALPYQDEIARKMLWKFKYQRTRGLAFALAEVLIKFLRKNGGEVLLKKEKTIIIPVPLFRSRLKDRGFNQSEKIAKLLSLYFQIPLRADILIKIKDTLPQAEIKGENREEILQKKRENIERAYDCQNSRILDGKIVILVDDVYTTGSTMKECSKTLRKAGAREVWGITLILG